MRLDPIELGDEKAPGARLVIPREILVDGPPDAENSAAVVMGREGVMMLLTMLSAWLDQVDRASGPAFVPALDATSTVQILRHLVNALLAPPGAKDDYRYLEQAQAADARLKLFEAKRDEDLA